MTPGALAASIDALLPQTQCTQCGYGGCLPYAHAIAAGEADINQCPPGGDTGVRKIAALLGREHKPLNPANGAEKPRAVALIDEARCIGCTLCIQACPVDAITGAARLMHTVIAELCTGCDLCLPPCPVDCIDMVPLPPAHRAWTKDMANAARERFQFRAFRLERDNTERAERLARMAGEKLSEPLPEDKKAVILAAIDRAKARRAAVKPANTKNLPARIQAEIAAIEARHAAAKKR